VIHPLQNYNHGLLAIKGVVIDGLVGTGFKGKATELLAEAIEKINASTATVFSIDIPSCLCGNTGAVGSVAVRADFTVYLELPKLGFFLDKGWDYVGKLISVSFGLPKTFLEQAMVSASLAIEPAMKEMLPIVNRTRHKYEAGYVLGIAGSESMPGAAILSCSATLHAGAGMVRLYHPPGMEESLSSSPPEVIKEEWDFAGMDSISSQLTKATSLLIGPGLGREKQVKKMLKMVLAKVSLPAVIDADALFFLGQNPSWILPKASVLTPHVGEMKHLLSTFDAKSANGDFFAECTLFAETKHVVLVVKGAPTIVFCAGKTPVIIPYGDPGMATAGSGDVLTGIIAALLAQKMQPFEAAILGVYLHAKSGEYASTAKTSYCMVASDIIEFLPKAFKSLLKSK
jgi:NAD(P)H-hydrate epimerase